MPVLRKAPNVSGNFMGTPFSDITIYSPTPYTVGTSEYLEEVSLINFVSDLYVQNMYGYKPPKTSRITIQPAYHDTWKKAWKYGSIVTIAPFFSHAEFSTLDKLGKYRYILDLIQTATTQLSDEYQWDKAVFENAYKKTRDNDFRFRIEYPAKRSRDRKKSGALVVTKSETMTSAYVNIDIDGSTMTKKLFEKKNSWCYDCIYYLARHTKWFDNDRFGVGLDKGKIEIWYSINKNEIKLYDDGQQVTEVDFSKYFLFN